jgi:arginine/lysine/histidine transporter system substrate-binding protein
MKRRTLLFTLLFTGTLSISTIAGCSGGQSGGGTSDAGGKKTLTMVTSPDYPPYEYYDTSGGQQKIIGFDVDIANYITQKLGYELRINESDFNGLIPALQAKRADFVMAGMTPTEERKKNVDFSILYYQAQDTIVAPKGSNLKTAQDLAGKNVGVQLGSIQEGNAKKIAEKAQGMQIKQLNKIPEIVQEIKAKRIDAAIIENTVAEGFIGANPDLEFNVIPPEGPSGSAIAFPKGSPLVEEFNKVLKEMEANGELKKLAEKWFSEAASTAPTPAPGAAPPPSPGSPAPSPSS